MTKLSASDSAEGLGVGEVVGERVGLIGEASLAVADIGKTGGNCRGGGGLPAWCWMKVDSSMLSSSNTSIS